MTVTRARSRATSLSTSSFFPPIAYSPVVKPVMLPPGCARLATRPVRDRVRYLHEHDRYRVSFLPQQRQYQCMIDNDDIRLHSDEFAGIEAGAIGIAASQTKLHPQVTAVDPAQLLQPLLQGSDATLPLGVVLGEDGEHADPTRLVRLLRARRERPSCRCTAEQCDELAPPHGAYPKA